MQRLGRNGYTDEEVKDMLHGKHGSRVVDFRYDLLDRNDRKKGELKRVTSGSISMSAFSNIKRTASFELEDEGLTKVERNDIATWNSYVGKKWTEI